MDKARNITLKILYNIDKNKAYSNIALDEEITKNRKELNEKDIGLISEITYGVTTWKLTLDEIIKKYSKIRIKKISPWIINILRMGAYQIIFLDKIPKSAAVNESVNLAKKYGHKASSNFVNAILRKIEKKDYQDILQKMKEIQNKKEINDEQIKIISVATSIPEWIIKKLIEEKPVNEVIKICEASNKKAKISIRVNTLKTTKQELKNTINKNKEIAEEALLENFLYINNIKNIKNLESFQKGMFTIQDEVASLPSLILQPQKNETILDACSAPGGKTTYIAELIEDTGKIEAWDIHKHRIKLIQENAQRLGITCIKTEIKDATKYNEKYKEKFDKILLDVPCLGLGVIKRKPDIKWQKYEENIEQIKEIQKQILKTCSKYLKKDGVIVYSTCSIIKEENEDIIKEFLKENPEYILEKIKPEQLSTNKKENYFSKFITDGYLKVYQDEKTDGFFIAKIKKYKN